MLSKLHSNILIYCIIPRLGDAGKRALSATCKEMFRIVERHCLANKSSIEDLCQRGEMLIIYKRNLKIDKPKTSCFVFEKGFINIIKRSIERESFYKSYMEKGLDLACRGGHRKIIDLIIKYSDKYIIDLNSGLYGACYGGCREIVDIMIELLIARKIIDWRAGLKGACRGGHREIVDLMVALMNSNEIAGDWEEGFYQACRGGHCEIINQMIALANSVENCSIDLDVGLFYACRHGNAECIRMITHLIGKESLDMRRVLGGACAGGHYGLAKAAVTLITQNRPSSGHYFYWNIGFYHACYGGNWKIIEMMFRLSINDIKRIGWSGALMAACRGDHDDVIELLLKILANNRVVIDWNKGMNIGCRERNQKFINLMIKNGATTCDLCGKPVNDHLADDQILIAEKLN